MERHRPKENDLRSGTPDEAGTGRTRQDDVYAGVDGWVEQFILRPGDIVNPLLRPAGILIPAEAGRVGIQAGFGQIEAQVIRKGMIGEVTCMAIPFTVIPVVVNDVQSVVASGQVRPTDQLIDPVQAAQPGTITAYLTPLVDGELDRLRPGSHCSANAYTNNHDALEAKDLSSFKRFVLHAIDAVGLVHAAILWLQALLLPVRTLVLGVGIRLVSSRLGYSVWGLHRKRFLGCLLTGLSLSFGNAQASEVVYLKSLDGNWSGKGSVRLRTNLPQRVSPANSL